MLDSFKTPLVVVGRILLALMFVQSGYGKLTDIPGTAAYMASGGLSPSSALVVLIGLIELVGGLAVVTGFCALGSIGSRGFHARGQLLVP